MAEPCECSWPQKAQAAGIIIVALGTAYGAYKTAMIQGHVETIQERQAKNTENIEKGMKAAEATEKTAARTEKAAMKIQAAVME